MGRGSGVHGQLVGEMIRVALMAPGFLWSIDTNEASFERGVVRLDLRLDVRDKTFGIAVESQVDRLKAANVDGGGALDFWRNSLRDEVTAACVLTRRAAEAYLETL